MGGFVKLDAGILMSTLWPDLTARNVFLTALLMAEPRELRAPAEQIEVASLEPTGWIVPAGWYGFVEAAGIAIVNRSGVERKEGLEALIRLGAPELDSRTTDFDGRRLVRVDGGYVVLNYIKYRERDYTGKERTARWRKKQKEKKEKKDGNGGDT